MSSSTISPIMLACSSVNGSRPLSWAPPKRISVMGERMHRSTPRAIRGVLSAL